MPEKPNRLSQNVAEPRDEEFVPPPPPPQPTERSSGRREAKPSSSRDTPGTATVYVSPNVKRRLEDYRIKQRLTNRNVILRAIEECHDRLADIIRDSTVSTAPASDLFPADPKAVRYLGGGGQPVQFTPTPAQAEVLDKIGKELQFDNRSTWIAPILNTFLPGRKDKA